MNKKKVIIEEKDTEEKPVIDSEVSSSEQVNSTEEIESSVDENTLLTESGDKIPSVFEGHKIVSIGDKKVSEAGTITYNCFCDDECRYDVPVISE